MGKSQPSAPDPVATANAQTQTNQATGQYNAELGHVNQNTPFGSETYSQTGTNPDGSPQYTSNISLNPQVQQQLNQIFGNNAQLGNIASSQLGSIANTLGTPLNTSSIPSLQYGATGGGIGVSSNVGSNGMGVTNNVNAGPLQSNINFSNLNAIPTSSADFNQAGLQAQNAVLSRMQPELDHDQGMLDNQLANQGIMPGSDAWSYEQKQLGQQKNDAYNQAVLAGNTQENQLYNQALQTRQQLSGEDTTQGNFYNNAQNQGFNQGLSNAQLNNSAQNQIFGQNLQNAQLRNSAQNQIYNQQLQNAGLNNSAVSQALQNQITERNLPLNEYNALQSASQIQTPTFQNYTPGSVQPAPIGSYIQGNYNAQTAANNSAQNSLFGLGGSLGVGALENPGSVASLMGGLGSLGSSIGSGLSAGLGSLASLFAL